MNKNTVKIGTTVCLVFLSLMMCAIGVRFVVRQVFIKRMGMDNALTRAVFFDKKNLQETNEDINKIEWQELYPFMNEINEKPLAEIKNNKKFGDAFEKRIDGVENAIETYATDFLPLYSNMINCANRYRKVVHWNFLLYNEYNGVFQIGDGYLSGKVAKHGVQESVDSTVDLSDFCTSRGIDFLYIQFPYKIGKYDEPGLVGVTDFSNQNADDFLAGLDAAGVENYDLRETIHEAGFYNHELFFKTDHHWKPETGLWASGQILRELRDRFGYDTNPELLDADHFDSVVYPDWFLGSQGKKVTLAACEPDDITLLYPKFETAFHYVIQDLGIDENGDFSVSYNMNNIDEKDLYNKSPYHAYNYGDKPLIRIENRLVENDTRVLIIHDSFSDCVLSFLACDLKYVDAIDLRYFTGSLETFIEQEKPDAVIVEYNPTAIAETIDRDTHADLFDFR